MGAPLAQKGLQRPPIQGPAQVKFLSSLPPLTNGRPVGSLNIDYGAIRQAIKARPRMWGELGYVGPDAAGNLVWRIKQGQMGFVPRGAYQATSRQGTVYVRYIGGP